MNLELRQYRYFVTLADTLHFGRAAELLGISQPALSQQLHVIEHAVGVPLLTRTGRRLWLTEVGTVFRDEAVAVLRQVERSETATARASRGETGVLSIGYVASAALSGLLPNLIVAFRHPHPDVQVSIREMDMPALIVAVAERELDIGFVHLPVRDLLDGVTLQRLDAEPVVAMLNAKHRLVRRARIDVVALCDETFICTHTQEGTGFYAATLEICAAAGFRPRVEALSRQMSTIISMVVAGFGVVRISGKLNARFGEVEQARREVLRCA
ncbi:LysR family transcriptional regulator [Burkholderia vietnamiensis]|uniref:LysR family transcriptional regulator n=1 Tax=Burkholderia vietnamiensis TaxID=60552 RepID=UPI0018DC5F31|nr:LysR family transcriptional regulator [Burkholderia vietnamiensis]MBH9645823.1 LysR family transcriptional regulator [Burkholderia vietnamiensis]